MFGAILGAGAALAGGLLSSSASRKASSTNAAIADEQIAFQKDYAKQRLQWQVADAKKAGLHPMVAAGLSPTSFSPVTPNIQAPDYSWMGDIGQNLDYAATKAKTQDQQKEAYAFMQASNKNTLRGQELDNQLKEMEILSMQSRIANSGTAGPPAPSLTGIVPNGLNGQPDSLVRPEPMRTTPHSETGKEPGSNPSVGWIQNTDGTFSPVMSEAAKERLEDDFIGELLWSGSNRLMPHLRWITGLGDSKHSEPPRSLLPKGAKRWRYTGWNSYAPDYD